MSLRVYDLAKELKISSAALMKHLSDMGVEVRSHMNYLEDEITNKIRTKFRSEVENLKKMENERKRIQEQLRDGKIEIPQHQEKTADSSYPEYESKQPKQEYHAPVQNPFVPAKPQSEEKSEPEKTQSSVEKENKTKPSESERKPQIAVTSEVPSPRFKEADSIIPASSKPEVKHRDSYHGNENRNRDVYQRQDNRGEGGQRPDYRNRDGYQRQDNRGEGGQRPDYRNRDGYQRQDNRGEGGQRPDYRNRDGYQRQDNRGEGGQRPDYQNREGYQRQDNRGEGGQRPDYRNRDGYQRQDNRGEGGQRPDYQNREGYQRQDNRGEGGQRPDYRNRDGYQRQDNRGEGGQRPDYRNRDGYQRQDNRGEGGQRPDYRNRDGYQRQDNRGEGGQRPDYRNRDGYQRQDGGGDRGRSDSSRRSTLVPQSKRPSFDKPTATKPLEEVKVEEKIFGKKKVTVDDLGDKSKHLQAKLKNTKKKKKGPEAPEIDEAATEKIIKQTLATGKKKKKYKKEDKKSNISEDGTTITISEFTSVSELAKIMDKSPSEIITKFFLMGKMVTINQRLDRESLELICDEFNLDVNFEDEYGSDLIEDQMSEYADVEEYHRPPVVTIMGHVDHGKTSILDYIRKTKVVAGESGGITQHIGAYQVTYKEHKITFLDTPGHEAFTAMRARGANITDIAVIVVAANDGVKPQTIEAIDHARAAGVTMIIAINKMDLPEANLDRTIANMLEQNVYLENWGGDVLWTKTSAITGEGIDELLELILLSSEMKELTAKYNIPGHGVVIEARKDPRMGSIATILLQEGTMRKGDNIVCGATYGHVRRMENERGMELPIINPCDICVLYGLSEVPKAGDIINVVESDRIARQISSERLLIRQEREKFQTTTNLGNLFNKIKQNEMNEVRLIVKGDTDGSVEALCDALQKLTNEEIAVNIIRKSVGGIIEADVNLASASDAIIIGFHVRANAKAKKLADDIGVDIRLYQIIFDAINDIKSAMSGMLAPEIKEKFVGHALVKQVFKIKKVGSVAGCFVEKGSVIREGLARLYRDDVVIFEGKISSLKHFQEEVKEVKAGSDCGILLKDYNDIRDNDIIEIYINEEIKREM